MNTRKGLLSLVICLLVGAAIAATASLSWTNPITNQDGSSIPASGVGALTSTTVQYGTCNAAKDALTSVVGTFSVAAPATSIASPELVPGTWCFQVASVNTYGNVSGWSSVASKTIASPVPNAPTKFAVN